MITDAQIMFLKTKYNNEHSETSMQANDGMPSPDVMNTAATILFAREIERLAVADAVTNAVEARDAELKNILSKVSDGAKERSARMDSAYGKAYFEDVSALIKFMVSELFPSGKDESNG